VKNGAIHHAAIGETTVCGLPYLNLPATERPSATWVLSPRAAARASVWGDVDCEACRAKLGVASVERQPTLPFNGRPPFVKGSDTSEDASDSMVHDAAGIRGRVLAAITESSDGLTCDQVELALVLRHQTASARVRELALLGSIADSGRRRPTRSGRGAAVWIAKTTKMAEAEERC
jgi:hypothetical protein